MGVSNGIRFDCPHCGKRLAAATGAAGKRVRCPTCTKVVAVPCPPEDAEESAAPAAPNPTAAQPTEHDDWPSEPKSVPVADGFNAVSFSRGGGHVAFVALQGKQCRAVIDGHAEQPYDQVTAVAFASAGRHYYYG